MLHEITTALESISTIQIQNSIYAVITSLLQSRVSILDITNPAQPVVKSVTTNTDNVNVRSPFAVSTVDIDGTAYAIVASRADSRIAIFNITNPMNLTQVSVLEHGEDYTLGGITNIIPIKMDGSTYILTAARDNNSVGIIDIGNPKMPRQVALFEDDDDLHSIKSLGDASRDRIRRVRFHPVTYRIKPHETAIVEDFSMQCGQNVMLNHHHLQRVPPVLAFSDFQCL